MSVCGGDWLSKIDAHTRLFLFARRGIRTSGGRTILTSKVVWLERLSDDAYRYSKDKGGPYLGTYL